LSSNPSSKKKKKKKKAKCVMAPAVPAAREAEEGGLLESRSSKSVWAT
jgi:hypothetical protein